MGGGPSTTTDGARRADIQGLRAVAVLLVVAFHTGVGPSGGFIGVDVFFVVSGFVIGGRLIREAERTGSVSLRSFMARRVRRILPAMAVCTVVVALASVVLLSPFGPAQSAPQQFALRTGAAASVFLANVDLYRHTGYFDGSAERNPFLHTWSLSVEEQFFLLLPLLLLVVGRIAGNRREGRRVRAVTGAVAAISAASLLLAAVLVSQGPGSWVEAPARLAFFAMPTRLWEFGAGLLLAHLVTRIHPLRSSVAGPLAGAGLLALLVTAWRLDPRSTDPLGWLVLVVMATSAVLAAGTAASPVRSVLSWGGLTRLGDVSYGWYLWHWPLIVFAGALAPGNVGAVLAVAVVSLVPAVVSYRYLEQPLRTGVTWRGSRTVWLGVGSVLVPFALCVSLLYGANRGWGMSEPADWYLYPPSQGTNCHLINQDARNTLDEEECSFGPAGRAGTVVVVGDATANSITPAVVAAAGSLDLRTVQWTRAGCPFVLGVVPTGYRRCEEWQSMVAARIAALEPDLVVVANQSVDYLDGAPLTDSASGRPPDPSGELALWQRGLERTVDELHGAGAPVLVVGSVPDFGSAFPRERINLLDPEPTVPRLARSTVERERAEVADAEAAAVADDGDAELLDPVPPLCGPRWCRPIVDGRWTYLGPADLTTEGSALLEPGVLRALRTLTGR
jgi:peptidoglycan/LPS O-acetylase OafA/YrhL